jgi:hypothetical protein
MAPTNGYCNVAELKARLWPTGVADTSDDAVFDQVITAVSREIDDHCSRRFFAMSEVRYYRAQYPDRLFVDDLIAVVTLQTDADGDREYETTWANDDDFDTEPYNAPLESQPYTRLAVTPRGRYTFPVGIKRGVKLAASFGYASAAPPAIKEACLIHSARLYKRRDAIFGVIGSAEMGQLMVIPKLDPDAHMLLATFRKL